MANVKLLQYDGSEKAYAGVRKVMLGTSDGGTALYSEGQAVEGVQIVPDFSQGDMAVEAPAGTLVKTAIVKKPENLIPGNIRKGATVAGVTGELIGDTEELSVDLDFVSGEDPQVVSDMVINPSAEGKVISRVTVKKPETLTPENIVKGVDIAGITGTMTAPTSEEKTIAPDFSGGDMELTPSEGAMFSKVTIEQPENLLPENIAEGVNIAGIIGTLAAGGGGDGDVKAFIKAVTINQTTSNYSSAVQLASVSELAAAGIVLDRTMPMYTSGSDIAYISLCRNSADTVLTGKIYSAYVTNLVQCKMSTRYRSYGAIHYYSSIFRDLGSSGMVTTNLYPVTYGSIEAGVEVTSAGAIQAKTRSSSYIFNGDYVLVVLYKKGS